MQFLIVGILDSVLGSHRAYARGECYYYCPFCHHKNQKLAVNVDRRVWHCWTCGKSGRTLLSLLRRLDVPPALRRELAELLRDEIPKLRAETVDTSLSLPEEYHPLWKRGTTMEFRAALSYVFNRGLTPQDILQYQIGYCESGRYHHRIIVPSFDADGRLNYFVARAYHDGFSLKYLNPTVSKNVVGFENQIYWKEPIVLVEGVMDAIAVKRNAIPLFGKLVPPKVRERIVSERVQDVYIALDEDALKETARAIHTLLNEGVNVWHVRLGGKDPSALGFPAMTRLVKAAKRMSFTDLIAMKVQLA